MSLSLNELLEFDDIVIQCHDNPDADALASGFALKWYLDKKGKNARFVYSGQKTVSKSNLVFMIEKLEIPVEYVTVLDKPQLLITVDCQYKESNVTYFDAENVAVIDHHQISGPVPELSEIRSSYGSCASVLFELLQNEDIDINENELVATALYYGLMTDTGGFEEISNPVDKDLRDYARPRKADIVLFRNSNLSRDELVIAGDALKHARYNEELEYSIVYSQPCDPNILGIISDMLLEVDSIDTCLVYSILPFGVKISVRSCVKEVKACELAAFLTKGFGGGGGHIIKAGGLLKKDLLEKAGIVYESRPIDDFLNGRMLSYFKNSEIKYAGEKAEDVSDMEHYIKKDVRVGYLKAMDLAGKDCRIMIRTLEGDIDINVDEETYIIIGVSGEVYPIKKSKFETSYKCVDDEYIYPGEYAPTVMNSMTGERMKILAHTKSCISIGKVGIYAKELDHRVKVFTKWDNTKYYLGEEGDYLAVREDDLTDVYIIAREIFNKTYSRI